MNSCVVYAWVQFIDDFISFCHNVIAEKKTQQQTQSSMSESCREDVLTLLFFFLSLLFLFYLLVFRQIQVLLIRLYTRICEFLNSFSSFLLFSISILGIHHTFFFLFRFFLGDAIKCLCMSVDFVFANIYCVHNFWIYKSDPQPQIA